MLNEDPLHPHRLLPLQGATNFRDLGGYIGHGNRPLRARRLFRADHLGGLTPEDHGTLRELGVTRAFDFRGVHESAAQAYDVPGLARHALAIEPSVAQEMHALARAGIPLTPARMEGLMHDLYRRLVTDNAPVFADWFGHLLDDASDDPAPLVFHCTAGKDRTGIAAMLLLRALGVDAAVVEQDYLLTNEHYRRPPAHDDRIPDDALAVLWSVRPGFLHTALGLIEQGPGGLEGYLGTAMKLSPAARARLAAAYLER
jgi:protein-tyrosine phosphatase